MDKKRLAELMEEKKPLEGCDHIWKQTGYWDGENIETHQLLNGPLAKCSKCGGKKSFTWEEWKALPEEIRTELKR
jgi:hypothetical protein